MNATERLVYLGARVVTLQQSYKDAEMVTRTEDVLPEGMLCSLQCVRLDLRT